MGFKIYFLLLFVFIASIVRGQDSLSIKLFIGDKIENDSTSIVAVFSNDYTSILNPNYFAQTKGSLRLSFVPDLHSKGWFSSSLVGKYFDNNIVLPRTDSAVTNANYDYGLTDSHIFNVDFSNKIGDSYINFLLNRESSAGVLNNSKYKSISILFDGLKNTGKWQYNYGYYKNSYSIGENGGIFNDSFLLNAESVDEFSIPTKLNTAMNEVELEGAYFENFYYFTEQDFKVDSLSNNQRSKGYSHGLGLKVSITKNQFNYSMQQSDIDSLFYSDVYYNLTSTNDSIGYLKTSYDLAYRLLDSSNREVLDVRVINDLYDWDILNGSIISLNAYNYRFGKLGLNSIYTYMGLWRGAYKFEINESFVIDNLMIDALVSYEKSLPSYFYLRYIGNHFQWNNDFDEIESLKAEIEGFHKKLNIGIKGTFHRSSNYVYMNSFSLPQQLNNSFNYYSFSLNHILQSKFIKLYTSGIFQGSSSEVIRFPELSFSSTFSYCFRLGELKLMTGFQASYFTSFLGMAYNPNLRELYLQDTEEVGGFPLLDAFASVKVGGVDIFVKWENVLFNTYSREFYLYPGYLAVPRMIRVGLNWKFIN